MNIFFLSCLVLGSIVVFQPAINRLLLEEKGLGFALWLNGCILFIVACLIFFPIYFSSEKFSELLGYKNAGLFRWWYILPGLMGFAMVFGVPIMIKNIGAFPTILAMLVGQVCTSFLWDLFATGQSFSLARISGVFLAIAGAYLSFKPAA